MKKKLYIMIFVGVLTVIGLIKNIYTTEGKIAIEYAIDKNGKYELDSIDELDGKKIIYHLSYLGGSSRITDCVDLSNWFSEYLENNPNYYLNDGYKIYFSVINMNSGVGSFTLSNSCIEIDDSIHDAFDSLCILFDIGLNIYEGDAECLSGIKYLVLQNDSYENLLRKLDRCFICLEYLNVNSKVVDINKIQELYPDLIVE